MAMGLRTGDRVNRREELNTRFVPKDFRAKGAAYRLQWVRERHTSTDIAQSNGHLLAAGSAGRRYVVLDGVPPNVVSRGHRGLLLIYSRCSPTGTSGHCRRNPVSGPGVGRYAPSRLPRPPRRPGWRLVEAYCPPPSSPLLHAFRPRHPPTARRSRRLSRPVPTQIPTKKRQKLFRGHLALRPDECRDVGSSIVRLRLRLRHSRPTSSAAFRVPPAPTRKLLPEGRNSISPFFLPIGV